MKKQIISTVIAVCIPLVSFALPQQKNNYALPLNKSQQVENSGKSLGSSKPEISKIKEIIEDEKMKLKTQSKPEKGRIISNPGKDQIGSFEELFQEHDFVKAFIAGGYSGH
jgi:hypothetical protein